MLTRFVSTLLAVVMASWSPALAQPRDGEIELLSKSDALRLFTMSKQQWEQNIDAAVAARAAVRLSDAPSGFIGMSVRTPDGMVTTRLSYANGDRKPDTVQVVIGYSPEQAQHFTDAAARDVIAAAQRQMAPEFDVMGDAERIQGGLAFFFFITEHGR